jgi:ABC-type Fe3+-hydroxamate transport system substrate-binding protein
VTAAGPRVISLVPSLTETLLAWDVVPVGVTRFCEQPGLRAVGGTKDPDIDAIVTLAPDLVVVNDEENRREDHDALVDAGLEVEVIRITSVADVAIELERLRARLGLGPAPFDPLPSSRPITTRVFVPIWKRPWMSIGNGTYGASALAHLGAGNIFDDVGSYPEVSLEEAARRRPDLVLAPSEPYPFGERHRAQLEEVAPVVLVDGQDLFWWGVRTPAALWRLRAVIG